MSRLEEKIKEYQASFRQKVPEELQKTMIQATNTLKDTRISDQALKTGDVVQNFTLQNVDGLMVSLDDVLKHKAFVLISFYRGGWCPYCNLELRALQGIQTCLEALHVELMAISPQTPDNSLSTKEKNELTFKVLSDVDNTVAKKFGLIFSLDETLKPIYAKFGIDIVNANHSESFELPMPATYIINTKKEIIYHFIDEDYTKRSEPEHILEHIKQYMI
ncbi:MAG: peroxiredoxin-like family protein [Sulfurospirillaceae bacterium]|nr:peroxiredoxin-like family protein [Sulfurospirillaceae bacterium]MDD2826128.1 peroxiredoxin-like family protein [Sulfurospirillaceae bacterium]